MTYLLDTNIIIALIRKSAFGNYIDAEYRPFSLGNYAVISAVIVGEIRSLALQNSWGQRRLQEFGELVNRLIVSDINVEEIIVRYAEIDAYSQGKLAGRLLNDSARNMGKNDLWIAATASVLKATLLTTDGDFNHLNNEFLTVNYLNKEQLGF
jgi:tRNA(fMet)-specific endonuclease VapC